MPTVGACRAALIVGEKSRIRVAGMAARTKRIYSIYIIELSRACTREPRSQRDHRPKPLRKPSRRRWRGEGTECSGVRRIRSKCLLVRDAERPIESAA